MLQSIDPATDLLLATYAPTPSDAIEARTAAAERTAASWGASPVEVRARALDAWAAELEDSCDDLAALITGEMGKLATEARAEVDKCVAACRWVASHGPAMLEDEPVTGAPARSCFVSYRPLGTVLAIMPWNFPLWQVVRFAAPALLAGNTVLLKHASNVPGCALALERTAGAAGLPEGSFATLLVGSGAMPALVADPRVRAVTFTGSTSAGRAVASAAGHALKPTVLELGGSDPYVVLEDADIAVAAELCAGARLVNAGQSCVAAKRFIVVDAVATQFVDAFVAAMARRRPGPPSSPDTTLAPLARRVFRDELHRQVVTAVDEGARLALGGTVPEGPGAYYPPTVLLDVSPEMHSWHEEFFGPVASVTRAHDEEEAIRLANATSYGLGACILTGDPDRGARIARDRIASGMCFVNTPVRSDPRVPFGGTKNSGWGRELGPSGLRAFTNPKTIWLA
jgi:succinate-semialdehyde dehydrogenase/glutarate-semialdehyde dehydrogenase